MQFNLPMKYLYFTLFPSLLFAQTINIDSLEQKGYHVYVHKRHVKPKIIVKQMIIRDTIWRERVVVRNDTVRIYSYVERSVAPQYVLITSPQVQASSFADRFTLALVGTGNTNGYEMHFGSTLALGERITFFIGAGCSYNSVLKRTRLDLGGHLIMRLLD
jgi:hypothetical protein